jgi:hypothetical protein
MTLGQAFYRKRGAILKVPYSAVRRTARSNFCVARRRPVTAGRGEGEAMARGARHVIRAVLE